jgi:hypothetical protein
VGVHDDALDDGVDGHCNYLNERHKICGIAGLLLGEWHRTTACLQPQDLSVQDRCFSVNDKLVL